jgi:tRNA A37 threonylcarbamoyladenosine synthetase subunit TsaC/SUA5/YrdC
LDGGLSDDLNPGLAGIGVRIPDAHFIRNLARQFGGALALTSANISNSISTVAVDEFQELWPKCALVFDGGRLQVRAGQTKWSAGYGKLPISLPLK